ncbi:MAG TPA: glycoside hydrolase N-terminal domain-containing protein [Candidatus Acidoferrales bacterium]|jgi:alpha-L-fucosidase 2|nr:glycoside hydrolase N-terminal domain-containing protein [Candidatus Acidoferrales bacterium]
MDRSKRLSLIGFAALAAVIGVAAGSLQVSVQAQNAPATAIQFTGEAPPPDGAMTLWYRQPAADHPYTPPAGGRGGGPGAAEWVRALPVGNGRLGAMVFGGLVNERLQLNEDTLWAGGPYDPVNPDALAALPEVRSLLFDGKYAEGAKLITDKVMAKPLAQMPYQDAEKV